MEQDGRNAHTSVIYKLLIPHAKSPRELVSKPYGYGLALRVSRAAEGCTGAWPQTVAYRQPPVATLSELRPLELGVHCIPCSAHHTLVKENIDSNS